ncbi:MAG: phenylalanine--tRNA ligase subunit alpha [Candidatus Auribacterota bacterium]
MQAKISALKQNAFSDIASAQDSNALEDCRIKWLGKKSETSQLLKGLKDVAPDQRPAVGALINDLKNEIESTINARRTEMEFEVISRQLEGEAIDVTLPGKRQGLGRVHPLTQTLDAVINIFHSLGFSVAEGPEIESEYYNFDALNIPTYHPARDMQDTFFLENGKLLRTHTSPVQIRVMENRTPPVRVIAPGRVYRNEAINARSYCLFHQVEGFYVDQKVTFAELKGVLGFFAQELFGKGTKIKLRPSYFPFTEPSLECDISCFLCHGSGCRVCKYSGWLEILGAGMIHPEVLKSAHYDPEKYQGYAFGMGIERITMLLYGINDIRLFFENDIRFLSQF